MATNMHPPIESSVAAPPSLPSSPTSMRRDSHWGFRSALAVLAAFMAMTTISGAIFVVPTMPRDVLHKGILALFPDFTIPALALGVLCGGAAVVAFILVLWRPRLGAVAAVVAGAFMIAFELVEIVVVGFTPAQTPDQWPAWLQVVYLVVGGALMALGARLWKAETGSYAPRWTAQ
jgi:hypothetical protein